MATIVTSIGANFTFAIQANAFGAQDLLVTAYPTDGGSGRYSSIIGLHPLPTKIGANLTRNCLTTLFSHSFLTCKMASNNLLDSCCSALNMPCVVHEAIVYVGRRRGVRGRRGWGCSTSLACIIIGRYVLHVMDTMHALGYYSMEWMFLAGPCGVPCLRVSSPDVRHNS